MPKIKVNDINIYYEIHGEGFPFIMIMGAAGDVNWWTPDIIETISKKFKTIIFDNRDTGRTDKPELDYSIKTFAEDTVGLMDALNIEKAYILGVSMGGMIAQEIALNYPQRIEKLVLCCTQCGGSKGVQPSNKILQIKFWEMKREEFFNLTVSFLFTENFIKSNLDYIESYKQRMRKIPIPAESQKRQIIAIQHFRTWLRLKNIKTPTLILHGREDILVPPENVEVLAKRIPGAKTKYFENAAHLVFTMEPELFSTTIIEFLK